jgi:hypothetical protein
LDGSHGGRSDAASDAVQEKNQETNESFQLTFLFIAMQILTSYLQWANSNLHNVAFLFFWVMGSK